MMLGPRTVSRIRLGECIRRAKPPPLKRSLHKVVKLPYENHEPQVNGLYPLYSKEAFNLAWTEYQGSLIEQVNRLTSGTAIAHEDLFNIVVLTAKSGDMAPLFNAASSAWNNAFCFFGILPQSQGVLEPTIPTSLRIKINTDFGSFEALRVLMFQTAMSIFGSGWVWLVLGPNSVLRVLASYNAGSPFDIPIPGQGPNSPWHLDVSSGPQQPGAQRTARKQEYLVMPLLGLNVWEHAYVPDYGCSLEGKQQYLKNWWAAINWQRVFDAQGRKTVRQTGAPRSY